MTTANVEKAMSSQEDPVTALNALNLQCALHPAIGKMQVIQNLISSLSVRIVTDIQGVGEKKNLMAGDITKLLVDKHVKMITCRLALENSGIYYHNMKGCSQKLIDGVVYELQNTNHLECEPCCTGSYDSDDEVSYRPLEKDEKGTVIKVSI